MKIDDHKYNICWDQPQGILIDNVSNSSIDQDQKEKSILRNYVITFTSSGMPWNWPAPSGGVQLYIAHGRNSTEVPPISSRKDFGLENLFVSKYGWDFTTQARANWSPSIREAFMYLELYTFSTSCRKIFALHPFTHHLFKVKKSI